MSIRLLSIALAALALGPSTALAQQGGVTQQCAVIRAMQWLTIVENGGVGPDYDAMAIRERVACGGGVEAADVEYWPSGATFRNGTTWYYPSGTYAAAGDTWYYPSGTYALSGGTWYYPHGGYARSGSTWYDWSGSYSSESALLSTVYARLSRERTDELLGLRANAAGDDFWQTVYFLVMVSEASR
jgi:hypothetical protein